MRRIGPIQADQTQNPPPVSFRRRIGPIQVDQAPNPPPASFRRRIGPIQVDPAPNPPTASFRRRIGPIQVDQAPNPPPASQGFVREMPTRKKSKQQGLPDDIIYDILVCLPVKTLCRFKCACKSWFSLISSTQFQEDHYRHGKNNPFLLTIRQISKRDEPFTLHLSTYNSDTVTLLNNFALQLPHECCGTIPSQSCLGLICFKSKFIYNPSTNELTALPYPQRYILCIGFGFGYAASTKEFKVLRFYIDIKWKYRCSVFTLGTTDWREVKTPPSVVTSEAAPFLHGALHFLPHFYRDGRTNDCITGFDVESEDYKTIPLPECYFTVVDRKKNTMLRLSEIGGLLCLNLAGIVEGQLDLWLLKDYMNGEWVKGYTIHLSSLMIDVSDGYNVRALAISGDGGILLDFSFRNKGRELLCYDPKEKIITHKIEEDCTGTVYVECLLPLEVAKHVVAH